MLRLDASPREGACRNHPAWPRDRSDTGDPRLRPGNARRAARAPPARQAHEVRFRGARGAARLAAQGDRGRGPKSTVERAARVVALFVAARACDRTAVSGARTVYRADARRPRRPPELRGGGYEPRRGP